MCPSFNVSLEARIRYKVFLFDLTGDLVHNLLHLKRACESNEPFVSLGFHRLPSLINIRCLLYLFCFISLNICMI